MHLGERVIYIDYADCMARSRLRLPAAAAGMIRNMNTVTRLAQMAACGNRDADQRGAA